MLVFIYLCAAMAEPQWLRSYLKFHRESTPATSQYLVYNCIATSGCGGIGDRVQSLSISFYLSVVLQRVFLIHNVFPVPLSDIWQPNMINWLQPNISSHCDYAVEHQFDAKQYALLNDTIKTKRVVCTNFRIGGNQLATILQHRTFTEHKTRDYGKFFGTAFSLLFRPTTELIHHINNITDQVGLRPIDARCFLCNRSSEKWFAAHIRDRWRVKPDINFGLDPEKHQYNPHLVETVASCAAVVQNNTTARLYIASDSATAKSALRQRLQSKVTVVFPIIPIVHFDQRRGGDHFWAWAEMLVLAHAPCIIAGTWSGYSRVASMLAESFLHSTSTYCHVPESNDIASCKQAAAIFASAITKKTSQ